MWATYNHRTTATPAGCCCFSHATDELMMMMMMMMLQAYAMLTDGCILVGGLLPLAIFKISLPHARLITLQLTL